MGFEPMIRVLQTLALPLGHVAVRALFYQRAGGWSSEMTKWHFYRHDFKSINRAILIGDCFALTFHEV